MAAPYSTDIYSVSGLTTLENLSAPPLICTVIIQAIDCYSNPDIVSQLFVEDYSTGGTFAYFKWALDVELDTTAQSFHWRGKQVFRIDDLLENPYVSFRSTDEPVDVRVSGTILEGIFIG